MLHRIIEYKRIFFKLNMSNTSGNAINVGRTPTRHLGLSRKRKSIGVSEADKISKQNKLSAASGIAQDNIDRSPKKKEHEVDLHVNEKDKKVENLETPTTEETKMTDLENLFSLWKNGCKDALLYLMNKMKERFPDYINMKQLLQELGIWEVLLYHFKEDPDFDFFLSANEV